MTTILKCSDYRCTKTTINAYRDDRGYTDRDQPPKASLRNILCNLHAGSLKRAKYQKDPLPLTDADRTRLLKEQAKVDEVERQAAAERQVEREQRDAEQHAAEWAFMDLSAEHSIVADTDSRLFEEEPTYEGHVWAEGSSESAWDRKWFKMEPSRRDYGRPGKRAYPYVIRVSRGSNLTPNEARALAAALIEGADKAEELNLTRQPA